MYLYSYIQKIRLFILNSEKFSGLFINSNGEYDFSIIKCL